MTWTNKIKQLSQVFSPKKIISFFRNYHICRKNALKKVIFYPLTFPQLVSQSRLKGHHCVYKIHKITIVYFLSTQLLSWQKSIQSKTFFRGKIIQSKTFHFFLEKALQQIDLRELFSWKKLRSYLISPTSSSLPCTSRRFNLLVFLLFNLLVSSNLLDFFLLLFSLLNLVSFNFLVSLRRGCIFFLRTIWKV